MWEHSGTLIRVIRYLLLHNTTSQEREKTRRHPPVVSWTEQENSVAARTQQASLP